jgi:hypothetical protein
MGAYTLAQATRGGEMSLMVSFGPGSRFKYEPTSDVVEAAEMAYRPAEERDQNSGPEPGAYPHSSGTVPGSAGMAPVPHWQRCQRQRRWMVQYTYQGPTQWNALASPEKPLI